MDEKIKDAQETPEIDKVEIEPLSDQDLEGVAGGEDTNWCSVSGCSNAQLAAE
jgi:hypothetical protein